MALTAQPQQAGETIPWRSTYTTVVSKLFSESLRSGLTPEQALDLPSIEKPAAKVAGEENYFNEYTTFIFSKEALHGKIEVGPSVSAAQQQFNDFSRFLQDMRNVEVNQLRPKLQFEEAQQFFFPAGKPPPQVKGEEVDFATATDSQKRGVWMQKMFEELKRGYPDFTGKAEDYDEIIRIAAQDPATVGEEASAQIDQLRSMLFNMNWYDAAYQAWTGLSSEQMVYEIPGTKPAAPVAPSTAYVATSEMEPEVGLTSRGLSSSTGAGG